MIRTVSILLRALSMNFFRRLHAHHKFHHHFGHGHYGHHLGRHADGFAHLLMARVGAKLDLDDEQQRHFAAWIEQIQKQRDVMKGLARGPELGDLMAGEQFPEQAARQLLDARLDGLRAAGPGLVGSFAAFFDSLNPGQREMLRGMTRRSGRHRHEGHAE